LDLQPPPSAEPPDLVALVRSPESPRELRLFAARGLLPLGNEDGARALLAVLLDGDSEIAAAARETFAAMPPDAFVAFLEDGEPTAAELDAIGRHSEDPFVLERVIRHRRVGDETLLAAMTERPELVNRPIVCTPKGVRLCRPAERVLELLERRPAAP